MGEVVATGTTLNLDYEQCCYPIEMELLGL